MLKFAVLDDMALDRDLLKNYINKFCRENNIMASIDLFADGKSFLQSAKLNKYEVAFLDIYIGQEDGIEIASQLREFDDKLLIIFSTTSEHHAIKSFRVRAFDYLVKPYTYLQFQEIMNLCRKTILQKSLYIEVKEGRDTTQILLSDITYVDYYNHYVQIHTKDIIIRTYMSFNDFWEKLNDDGRFLCCYRNCAVNMDEVAGISDNDFTITTGEIVPIAKPGRREIKRIYAEYIFYKMEEEI